MGKEFVLPGYKLSDNIKQAGFGTYIKNGSVYAAICGLVVRKQKISIIPFSGPYIPSENDLVIGYLTASTPSNWIFDIAGPYDAFLHASEFPFRVPSDQMNKHFSEGDVAVLRVREVKPDGTVELTFKGDPSLKKLTTGNIVEISSWKVSRVIGRSGSMISILESKTNCDVFVGHNGRIWIDGSDEDMNILTKALLKIEEKAHISGLTDMISNFLDDMYSRNEIKNSAEKSIGKSFDESFDKSVAETDDNTSEETDEDSFNQHEKNIDQSDKSNQFGTRRNSASGKPRSYRLKSFKDQSSEDISENLNKSVGNRNKKDNDEVREVNEEIIENKEYKEDKKSELNCVCFKNFYF